MWQYYGMLNKFTILWLGDATHTQWPQSLHFNKDSIDEHDDENEKKGKLVKDSRIGEKIFLHWWELE